MRLPGVLSGTCPSGTKCFYNQVSPRVLSNHPGGWGGRMGTPGNLRTPLSAPHHASPPSPSPHSTLPHTPSWGYRALEGSGATQ